VIRQFGSTDDDLSTCMALLTRHLQVQLHVCLVDDAGSWCRNVWYRNSVESSAAALTDTARWSHTVETLRLMQPALPVKIPCINLYRFTSSRD
jgi:hypothetical protein